MPAEAHQVRGIPLWLLREYLEEAGGRATDDHHVVGDGWTAHLTQIEDYQIGSLRVGQVRLELAGDSHGLARIQALLEPKLWRAGG